MLDTKSKTLNVRHKMQNTKCQTPNQKHQMLDTKCKTQMKNTKHYNAKRCNTQMKNTECNTQNAKMV